MTNTSADGCRHHPDRTANTVLLLATRERLCPECPSRYAAERRVSAPVANPGPKPTRPATHSGGRVFAKPSLDIYDRAA